MKYSRIILSLIVLSFLSVCAVAQAKQQTKQELNVQLRDNLKAFKPYYDRWAEVLRSDDSKLRKAISEYDTAVIRNEQRQATELSDAFALLMKRYEQLQRLGKNPEAIVSLPDIKAQIARFEYRNVVPDISEMKSWTPVIAEFSDVSPPEKMSLKDQNEWMRQKLQSVHRSDTANHSSIYRVEQYQKTVQSAKLKLDSLYLEYENVLNIIAVEERLLKDSINDLWYFSLQDYPNNFSLIYEKEFGKPFEGNKAESIDPDYYIYPTDQDNEFVKYANPIPMNTFSKAMMNEKQPVLLHDQPAEFPVGKMAMNKYILSQIRISEKAEELGFRGRIVVKFKVSKTGKVSDVKVIKGLPECRECDDEVVRLMQTMPDWIPGKVRGRKADTYVQIPITFSAD